MNWKIALKEKRDAFLLHVVLMDWDYIIKKITVTAVQGGVAALSASTLTGTNVFSLNALATVTGGVVGAILSLAYNVAIQWDKEHRRNTEIPDNSDAER